MDSRAKKVQTNIASRQPGGDCVVHDIVIKGCVWETVNQLVQTLQMCIWVDGWDCQRKLPLLVMVIATQSLGRCNSLYSTFFWFYKCINKYRGQL